MAVTPLSTAYAVAGGILVYSGLTGDTVSGTVRTLLAGRVPAGHVQAPVPVPAATASSGSAFGPPGLGTTSSAVANDALQYTGHPYLFGGAPGPDGTHPWDCSSFCNWVINHDLGLPIPGFAGGAWNPSTHGPPTGAWLLWGGAATMGTGASAAAAAQPGDICVWQTHMGIATGGGQMISALNEHLGTQVTSITGGGPGGELLFVRRLAQSAGAPVIVGGKT